MIYRNRKGRTEPALDMVPNDVINRISRIDRQLQAEEQTDQIKLARNRLTEAIFWITEEKDRRVEQKRRVQEARLAEQEENPS